MSVIHYNGKNVKTPRARRATTRPRPSPMTNRPARPHSPSPPSPTTNRPARPGAAPPRSPAAPHHPAVATPSTRRPGAPPARSGSVHRRRRTAISVIHAPEPHPHTGDAALILPERPAPHPPPNGIPSSRRRTLLPTGRSLLLAPHPPPDGASSSPEAVFFPRSRSVLLRHSSRRRSGYWRRPWPVAGQPLRVPAFNATPLSAPVVVPRDQSVLPSPSILLSLPSDQVIPRWLKVPCCSYG